MRIYIASKVKHATRWRELRSQGVDIISTWIDEAGEGESEDLTDLAFRCINEIKLCDILILYAEEGETLKGALVEAGAALMAGKIVYSIGPTIGVGSAFRKHLLWINYSLMSIDPMELIRTFY